MISKMFWSHSFLIICVVSCYHLSNAQDIHLYSEPNSKGKTLEISISQCSNLPDDMAGKVTSINTEGHCARFFDAQNCSGNSIEVAAWSPTHYNLGYWSFDKKIRSVSSCRSSCDRDITGDPPGLGERLDLEIYSQPDFKGISKKLKVLGCTPVPSRFVFQFKSVKTLGRCFQLYNNEKCQDIGPFTALSSIELRPGTPFHSDISIWAFTKVQAVSHCTYKCNDTVKENDKSTQKESGEVPLKPHDVVLYDRKNYSGNAVHLTVLSCVDIQNDWEGAAVSIKSFNGSCVTLYEDSGCVGDSINVAGFNPDLSVRSFDALARSIQPCYPLQLSSEGDKRTGRSDQISGNLTVESISPLIISIIIIVPLSGVILSMVLVLFIMRKCNPYKNIIDKLSDKEIDDFVKGLGIDLERNDEGEAGETDGDYSAELVAQKQPYNEAYEIPRANIKFNVKCPLGMGEFGVVYKGTILATDEIETSKGKTVAVKTIKPSSSVQYLRAMLKEVKIMLYVGRHEHIVQMVGCCTENLRKGEILLLMEFCAGGSLESFLLRNRTKFKNLVRKGRLLDDDDSKTTYTNNLDSALDSTRYQNVVGQKTDQNFDFFQLLRWCIEIANGMEFLASKKVIHSDLAARNVLLDKRFRTKISDFGLSRQLYCYTEYVKKKQEPLPWRWLAIESLNSLQFSTKSDVWGFAVLCWEIFTLGEKPYPGVLYNDDFLRNLKEGMRMTKPKYAVSECYNLMIKCWDEEPEHRPTFSVIKEELQDILTSLRPLQSQSESDYLQLHES